MNVTDLTETLECTAALHEAAKHAGITAEQARRFAARLADMRVRTALAICTLALDAEERQTQRALRKGDRR